MTKIIAVNDICQQQYHPGIYLYCIIEETKPIKRSKELAPLSREHHDGLLYVWKIREGLKNGAPISKLKEYSVWYWKQHIKPHFFQEEKILLPHMPANHELTKRLMKEHENIRGLILHLDRDADKTTFIQLCDLLNDHIRFEERLVFPFLEETLPSEELTNIFFELEQHPLGCENPMAIGWKDEFWLKK